MRCKVRYIARTRSGSVSHSDHTLDIPARRVALGRGTDSHVHLKDLRVSYHHADIVVRDYDVVIEAVGESVVRVDGVPVARAVVTPDSEVEVGPYRLQLVPGEPDADLTLSVELVAPAPTATLDKLLGGRRLGLESGMLRKRPLSWALFALVILTGLALPMLAHRTPEPGQALPPTAADAEVAEQNAPLAGFDRIWISGDLSSSHKLLTEDCGACHERPFVPVRREACASCHADVEHHFETARFQFEGFEPTGCMGCHTEHKGPAGVIPAYQSLCADCHRDLTRRAPETALLDAADFGAAHPEFRPSVITDPGSGRIERTALGAPDFPKERSNLSFPHRVHLAEACEVPAGATAETLRDVPPETRKQCTVLQMARQRMQKDALQCGDCHRPEPGGVNMLPVGMQDHCAICHRLEFDPNAPSRILPHGQPEEVIAVISDFYAAEALRGGSLATAQSAPSQEPVRQRPGGAGAGAAPAARPVPPDPAADALAMTERKLESIFGRSLCGVCHVTASPAESATRQWEVRPVRVTPLWMPKAIFDHAAHQTTPCMECHEATTSKSSEEVLMPKIETCRRCHQGEHATQAIPSTCILCHVYHRDELAPMLPAATQPAAAHR